jgi:hypothetical protein
MMALVYVLLAIASVGFCAVAAVHLEALAGSTVLFHHAEKLMFPVLFVLWIPTIFCMNRMTGDAKQKDIWKIALRGCPKWMRIAAFIIFGYAWAGALANALLFRTDPLLSGARGTSGVMLAFYGVAACVLYSFTRSAAVDEGRRCLNGHKVGPLAKYCEECGSPVASDMAKPLRPD